MKCVLIVNPCGMLSAMPTLEDFNKLGFETDGKVFGEVEVSEADAALVYQERSRIRVLLPDLPGLITEPAWLYLTVIRGEVRLV